MAANPLSALVSFLFGRDALGRRVPTHVLTDRALAAELNESPLAGRLVADERRRIARELHDVVTHEVSPIGALATAARRNLRRDTDAANDALSDIETISRATLRTMRRLLDMLPMDAEASDDELTPLPDLSDVSTLVDELRDAGLPVRLQMDGEAVPLDRGVAVTVYRIVQGALTSTLKNPAAATATVRLGFGERGLTVEVSGTVPGSVQHISSSIGYGLVRMQERVALYGGSLCAGFSAGGRFRVRVIIPAAQLGARL